MTVRTGLIQEAMAVSERARQHLEKHHASRSWTEIIERLRAALGQALRQWRMYADMVEDRDEFDLATEKSPEADLYRAGLALLRALEQSASETSD